MYSKDGTNLFSNITLSSAEESLLNQYIITAAQNVEAALRTLVTSYSVTPNTSITITITNTRGNSDFDARCGEMINSYSALFATGRYLGKTHPDLAGDFNTDAEMAMQALLLYAFFKKTPTQSGTSYNQINGAIT